ncbi:MAG: metallophosphoesterase [Rhodospirillaceae bacterium]|nr:metallophosphoesterase [Rhodospirillaceae bacterium]
MNTTGRIAAFGAGVALIVGTLSTVPRIGAQGAAAENIILGRPTADSITVHALAEAGAEVFVEYGGQPGNHVHRTGSVEASADNTAEVTIEALQSNSRYFYRVNYRGAGDAEFRAGDEHSFHTQRPPGSTFTFGVQGDSHPERTETMYHPDLYARTMEQVASARPDLYFMLGDDFNVSRLVADYFQGDREILTRHVVDDVYLDQRGFLGIMAHSTALFPVIGNHEEARRNLLGTVLHDVAIFTGNARVRWLPLPAPDDFYTGNPEPVEGIGLLRDYFAFTWGDALFVVLDPYWHSPVAINPVGRGGMAMGTGTSPPWGEIEEAWLELALPEDDRWQATMGERQYQWLKETLEGSDAKYKFVFAHHVLGTGRGGIERAHSYEWGGHGEDGTWDFDERRPGWELPVHHLMVENGVTIFFQGHDHLFAHQELGGVVYQTAPNPADDRYLGRNKQSYLSGTVLDNSGYLNVTVAPEGVTVDYIRSWLPEDEVDGRVQGEVAYSYTVN